MFLFGGKGSPAPWKDWSPAARIAVVIGIPVAVGALAYVLFF